MISSDYSGCLRHFSADNCNNSRFIKAADDWNIPLMEECLRAGADVNYINDYGVTALNNAIAYFQWHGLTEDECNKMPPEKLKELEKANLEKCLNVVKFLLANGADINLFGNDEIPPLMTAIYTQSTEMVRFLLEHGANPNFICYPKERGPQYRSDAMANYDEMLYEEYDKKAAEQHYLLYQYGARLYKYDYIPETQKYLGKHVIYMAPGNKKGYILFDNDNWGIDRFICGHRRC